MIHKVVRAIVFPVVAFTAIVSVGFAAWAFQDSGSATTEVQGNVEVTALWEGAPGVFKVNSGEDYTSEPQYYTLVFGEDQTFDEDVGITLYPSIQFVFSEFYLPPDGYSYYLSYQTNFVYGDLYSKYVTIPDSLLEESLTQSQTSTKVALDVSGATPMTTAGNEEQYTLSGSFTPTFKWRSSSKPTNREAFNSFIEEVNSSTDTFLITIILSFGVLA